MKLSIHEQENELFEEWRAYVHAQGQHFITDGVVDEAEWEVAPRKIVFLLREANSEEQDWDERSYLHDYPQADPSRTVRALAQWIPGVLCMSEPPTWPWVYEFTNSRLTQVDLLRKICWVNVKKTPGGDHVDEVAFRAYWRQLANQQFLRQQLDLYSPDIVVCCGTCWNYVEAYADAGLVAQKNEDGIEYYLQGKRLVINFYHPIATTYTREKFYNLLCKVVRENKA